VNQSISIVIDGILQTATTYTVTGNQLTFNVSPAIGSVITISFNAVQITFVRLGANPTTPGFIPAAPPMGAEVIISAEVEGIWENLLFQDAHDLSFGATQASWPIGVESLIPNTDPATNGLFPFIGVPLNGSELGTALPNAGSITDGGGMMAATTPQALFIRGITGTYATP
jgi:hypothetical protein